MSAFDIILAVFQYGVSRRSLRVQGANKGWWGGGRHKHASTFTLTRLRIRLPQMLSFEQRLA